MPHITIQMIPGRTSDEKEEIALGIQQFLSKTYGIDEQVISVSIEDVPKEQWSAVIAKIPESTMFVKPGY